MRRATGTHEEEEPRSRTRKPKAIRLPGCCFMAQARRQHSAMDGSKMRHPERTERPPPPSEASSRIQSTCSISNSNSRSRGAEQPRSAPTETTRTATKPSKTTGAGGYVGAFSPVVGLSVVIAMCMAGLLCGRFCAVACVCAWLAALSRLRRREAAATTTASEVVAVDVEPAVVLRRLLERDRRQAVSAA